MRSLIALPFLFLSVRSRLTVDNFDVCLPLIATKQRTCRDVRKVPTADILPAVRNDEAATEAAFSDIAFRSSTRCEFMTRPFQENEACRGWYWA